MTISIASTFHGSRLLINLSSGFVCHGQPDTVGHVTLYVWQVTSKPHWFFLIPERPLARPMRFEHEFASGRVISLWGAPMPDGGTYFRYPISGNIISAIEASEGFGEVVVNRSEPKEWETFNVQPLSEPPPFVVEEVDRLLLIVVHCESAAQLLAYLDEPQENSMPGYLGACLQFLPVDQLEWLARTILVRPTALRHLASSMPDDIWASQALPALAAHHQGHGAENRSQKIEASLGYLATSAIWGKYVSAGQMMNSFARRSLPAAKGICVVAAARNEGLYLLEWLAYHRKVGVQSFFIYTNDNDDASDGLLSVLAEAGIITWISIETVPDINPQHMAYGHAFQLLPELLDYRWAAVIDIDEFIVIDSQQFVDLGAFLASLEWQKTDAVALSWVMFGPDGQTRRSNLPVTKRFRGREGSVHPLIKTISRPCMFTHSRCHNPIWDDFTSVTYRNAVGASHPQVIAGDVAAFSPHPTDQLAWVNHYHSKSAEEYILRRAKSPPERLARQPSGAFFTSEHAHNFVNLLRQDAPRDPRIFRCVPDLEGEIDDLRGLPGVGAAMAAIEANYADRLKRLSEVLAADPRFSVPESPESWFKDVISKQVQRARPG